jgi:hypothetical protein
MYASASTNDETDDVVDHAGFVAVEVGELERLVVDQQK